MMPLHRAVWLGLFSLVVLLLSLVAQEPAEFICPMDPEIRETRAGKCPRCGMNLVVGLRDSKQYPVDLAIAPRAFRAGQPLRMTFRVTDPGSRRAVKHFEIVHEKLFHLFVVSQDLEYFAHEHPEIQSDGSFSLATTLPKPGQYRLLCDFLPKGGTVQLAARTLLAAGSSRPADLQVDLDPKRSVNAHASLTVEPAQPIAGMRTRFFFHLEPGEGLEPYLGAWGHLLVASEDLIDLIHSHPVFTQGGPTLRFDLIFPRSGMHRVWVQCQRQGKVNTFAFNVPVAELQ